MSDDKETPTTVESPSDGNLGLLAAVCLECEGWTIHELSAEAANCQECGQRQSLRAIAC